MNLMGNPDDVLAWPYFHEFLPGILKYGAPQSELVSFCTCCTPLSGALGICRGALQRQYVRDPR